MSTPEDPRTPEQRPDEPPADATGEQPPVPPPPPAAAPAPAAFGPPAYAQPPGMWVAPPRQFWVNPAKRVSVLVVSVVAALALLAIGGVIGAVVSDNGGGHDHYVRVIPGYGPGGRFMPDKLPQFPGGGPNGPSRAPTK